MTEVHDVRQTTCCVVGAGPAGAMLALLLARQNVPVVLLEAHGDFDRDFRGDSLHPAILEVLDEFGLADRLLAELPHRKIHQATLPTGIPAVIDFARLRHRTRFPFMTLMPQARFLEFLTAEAAHSPCFELVRRANVRELLVDGDAVRGVRYRAPDGWHEIRALLTVGADGRFSQVRRQSGLQARTTASAIDVLWLRLPRLPTDPEGILGRVGHGTILLLADRGQLWQLGMIIPKGSFPALRDAGLDSLQRTIAELVPWLADRVGHLRAWSQVSLLSVQADRLVRWWRPGLLLIGDAAHVMSPVAGNGINYAVADAVATANLLRDPLAAGTLADRDLMAVQRRRDWPTRITQTAVGLLQDRMLARALRWQAGPPRAVAVLLRVLLGVPRLANLPLRVAAFGLRPEHVASTAQAAAQVRDCRDP
jgi:2-polyprenyl-6-methoxyphenol hydroxylase-like FAD-dependent oxidoreductase